MRLWSSPSPAQAIVTSGHGGVFPRGIPIGVVVGPEGGEEGWQRNYLIQPMVGPSEMTYVLVLGNPQRTLEGRDLALAWGIRPADPAPPATDVAIPPSALPGPGSAQSGGQATGGPGAPSAPPAPPEADGPAFLGVPTQPPQ